MSTTAIIHLTRTSNSTLWYTEDEKYFFLVSYVATLLWILSDLEFSALEKNSQGPPPVKGQVEKEKQTEDR